MGARRKGRELAVQALYQIALSGEASAQSLAMFWEQADAGERAREFAAELLTGVRARQTEIDVLIEKASTHWKIDRLAPVDLSILRVATFELMASENPPTSVILNEAIEIAKRFGTSDSKTFINGVLDHIAAKLGVKDNVVEIEAQDDG